MKTLQWSPELVRKFWSGVTATRLTELSFGRLSGEAFVKTVREYLSTSEKHLDYGAGDGHIVSALLELGYATGAYEIAPARRDQILRAPFSNHPLFLGVTGPEDTAQYDTVIMTDVIEHILEGEELSTFTQVKRLLSPGGRLILTTPYAEDLDLAAAYCPVCDHLFHRWQHVRSFTEESLSQYLEKQGFRCRLVKRQDFTSAFDLFERLRALEVRVSGLEDGRASPVEVDGVRTEISLLNRQLRRMRGRWFSQLAPVRFARRARDAFRQYGTSKGTRSSSESHLLAIAEVS
jgi:SAM-dependent methyltransferase